MSFSGRARREKLLLFLRAPVNTYAWAARAREATITGNSNDDKRHGAERDGRGSRADSSDGSTVDPDQFGALLIGATEGSDPRAVVPPAEDSEQPQGRHSVAVVEEHLVWPDLLSVGLARVAGLNETAEGANGTEA